MNQYINQKYISRLLTFSEYILFEFKVKNKN